MTEAEPALRFQADAGTGLPRLLDPRQCLDPETWARLDDEIRRRFEELVASKPGTVYRLPTGHAAAQPYHVTVRRARGQRCPTLELALASDGVNGSPVAARESAPERSTTADLLPWWQAFDQELERACGAESAGSLQFVLQDLRAVMAARPERLLPLLLAGYLRVGDGICRAHGDNGRNEYARCALTVQRLFADALPRGALDELIAGTRPSLVR